MIQFVIHLLVTAGLLSVVGYMVSGIEVEDGTAAVIGALVLGFANAFIRPLLVLLTLPITFLTLGLFVWVVNAFMLKLTAAFVPGFKVEGFRAAMVGSLFLGILNIMVAAFFGI
ncbi:MAG: phage holin family protein [Gemmatimonadetes bacterium]|jgi:putative membrane protein|nr:phage holin family protein [Gemmatimonadota bacterium]